LTEPHPAKYSPDAEVREPHPAKYSPDAEVTETSFRASPVATGDRN
jgi:hypothetical protein